MMKSSKGKRIPALISTLCFLVMIFLIPAVYAAKGAGTENRDWVEGEKNPSVSQPLYEISETEIRIAMRDGIELQAFLYFPVLPDDADAIPAVVCATGYGVEGFLKTIFEPDLIDLAKRGYGVVFVGLRGTGTSEGESTLYNLYGEDGYDLVEWVAVQSWCNGNVGMVGPSLLGISQWLTAKQAPPHLKAIVPHVACGDCYDFLWYPGGMLPGPGRIARGEPEYTSAVDHRDFDSWWQVRTVSAGDIENIADAGIAAMITGGFNDYITPGNIKAYEEYPGDDKMLIIGPWAHGPAPNLMPYSYQDFQAMWLDYYLKEEENTIPYQPKALLYVAGADQWRFEENWPIADTRNVALYLRADTSGTIAGLNDGSLLPAAPSADNAVSIDYSPVDGPFLETMLSSTTGRLTNDKQSEEALCLTWTSAALDEATEITGWPTLTIWAASTAEDADFVVQITDVAPDGSSTQVTCGFLNAARAADRSAPETLVPGTVGRYTMAIQPIAYVFDAGHRIRLDLAGGSIAAADQAGPQGPGLNPTASTITIYQDADHPSQLVLPVVGTGLTIEAPPAEDNDDNGGGGGNSTCFITSLWFTPNE